MSDSNNLSDSKAIDRSQREAFYKRQGIFGMGLSINPYLEIITMLFLIYTGIFIKLFFEATPTINGLNGPATTTIWGYSLSAFALFILLFSSMYLQKNKLKFLEFNTNTSETFFNKVKDVINSFIGLHSIPILLTLLFVIFIIILNFNYYKKINSNSVSDSYNQYSNYSTFLLLIQVMLLSKYILDSLDESVRNNISNTNKNVGKIKGFSIILTTINFIFGLIMYILLNFYTTDDGNYEEFS